MMHRQHAALAAILGSVLVVAAAGLSGAQQPQQQQQPPPPAAPAFRSGVEALPIDVTVVNGRGEPVRDLIASDFAVRLDGKPRRVLSAQWIASATDAKRPAAALLPDGYVSNEQAAGGRLIVLVIDQPNIPFGEMRPLRAAIEAFIDRWNDRCQPFTWTKTPDEIIPRATAGQRTSIARH